MFTSALKKGLRVYLVVLTMKVDPLLEEQGQTVVRNPVKTALVNIVELVAAAVAKWVERVDQEVVQETTIAQIVVDFHSLGGVAMGVVLVFVLWGDLVTGLTQDFLRREIYCSLGNSDFLALPSPVRETLRILPGPFQLLSSHVRMIFV